MCGSPRPIRAHIPKSPRTTSPPPPTGWITAFSHRVQGINAGVQDGSVQWVPGDIVLRYHGAGDLYGGTQGFWRYATDILAELRPAR